MLQHRLPRNAAGILAPGLLLLGLLATGCSTQRPASAPDPVAPGSSAGALLGADPGALTSDRVAGNSMFLMPLAVGNKWDYSVRMRTRMSSPGAPDVIEEQEYPWVSELVGTVTLNSQEYFLQAEYDPRTLGVELVTYALRQNRTGLYGVDSFRLGPQFAPDARSTQRPDARFEQVLAAAAAKSRHPEAFTAAAKRLAGRMSIMSMAGRGQGLPGMPEIPGQPARGDGAGVLRRGDALPGEITLLLYPMVVGSRWIVRDSPRFTRAVEGRGVTTVPAGLFETWILRGHSELYGRGDVVRFHYAREGLVRISVHAEQAVIDSTGNPLGRMLTDMDQSLTALRLAEPVN